jgi:hypothetical protein
MMIIDLIVGFLLLIAGRELFWLSVGITGFIVGMNYSSLMGVQGLWSSLAWSILFGILGAVLAMVFEWFAVVFILGFLGGGYLLTILFPLILPGHERYDWQLFFIGGTLGAMFIVLSFDWALIIVSSLLGAGIIAHSLQGSGESWQNIILIVSIIVGILIQALSLKKSSTAEN